jgi:ATP-dependent DNA helicase RecG
MILDPKIHLRKIPELVQPLTCLKGVGPKKASLLARKGLHTVLDLLYFRPIRYEDRTRITPIKDVPEGTSALVTGNVVYGREERFPRSRKRLFRIGVEEKGHPLELLWFQYRRPQLTGLAQPGNQILIYGAVQRNGRKRQMVHPEVRVLTGPKSDLDSLLGFYPIYSGTPGISPHAFRSLVKSALDRYLPTLIDPIPPEVRKRLKLPDLAEALRNVHHPPKESSLDELNQCRTPFLNRLLFDRYLLLMLAMVFRKALRRKRPTPPFSVPSASIQHLQGHFPFNFTRDQTRTITDIIEDVKSGRPMSRLVLGDVGCGKTVVAAAAAYLAVLNHVQVAVMVPTQVLANQHFGTFSGLSEQMGLRPVLLTSDLTGRERDKVYRGIKRGDYNLVVGTHSLIQKGVSFAKLGLVVIDEQQRFGVRERALLDRKGNNPHVLVMTATPIPRTLAITLYGDMDVSVIREFPKGHKPVATRLVTAKEKRAVFELLKQRLASGQQAFVICPVVEGSEDTDLKDATEMAAKLKKLLQPPYRVELVHGRMPAEHKERTMDAFREGSTDLLVGTTVVEVGVHVPNATVMIVEHPERFGLAQLHQLRGRVGRGAERGICLLITSDQLSEKARTRLNVLVASHDGFEVAQRDLEMRGQGEVVGTKQAGIGELDYAEILAAPGLLGQARKEAERLVESDPDLALSRHAFLKDMLASILDKAPSDY